MYFKPLIISFFFMSSNIHSLNFNRRTLMNLKMKKDNIKHISKHYLPKTINQEKYVNYLNDEKNDIIIVVGPAGTGKTMFGCLKAINLLNDKIINKLIITRPVVSVEEEIGFLPGDIVQKMDPWTKPIFDLFLEFYSKSELDQMINSNIIEIAPLAFMRGRTFKNSFIIADEMQNSSPNQMKMLTTRLGINTKMIITGDLKQSDIKGENGLNDLLKKIEFFEKNSDKNKNNNDEYIKIVELEQDDIERSRIVKKIIEIYDFKPNITNANISTTKVIRPKLIDNDAAMIPINHYKSL